MFDVLEEADDINDIIYECGSKGYAPLFEKYHIDKIAVGDTDFERAFALMRWLNSILIHLPDYHNKEDDDSVSLLNLLMNKEPINCRAAANIMVECCLALGMKSRAVWLLPANPYDKDCHVVPIVYCRELNKWVMFDATVNSIVKDENDIPLSPLEIRKKLARKEEIFFLDTLKYVKTECTYTVQQNMFKKYLLKNLFMMRTYRINCRGYEGTKNQEIIYLVCDKFDINRYCMLQNDYWKNNI